MEHRLQLQSTRTVKPKSGSNCSIVPLSTCDLAIPNVYAMAIYAFKSGGSSSSSSNSSSRIGNSGSGSGGGSTTTTEQLEKGLEDVLSDYPEWAGRLTRDPTTNKVSVHLNDRGVSLSEATMDQSLDELMPFDPSPLLSRLVPATHVGTEELLLVQVTSLSCGGSVLGVAWHHRLADGQAFFTFMDSWSRHCRGEPVTARPFRDRAALTARHDARPLTDDYLLLPSPPPPPPPSPAPPLAARKLHFGVDFLRRLKCTARGDDGEGDAVTTFESLTAHLWRCITIARGLEAEVRTQIMIPMNGRTRLRPPLPETYFGNATFMPASGTAAGELVSRPLRHAARLVHGAIAKADDEYLRGAIDLMEARNRLGGGDAAAGGTAAAEAVVPPSMTPHVVVTSWVRFPLYDVDFGWGPPFYVGNVLDLFEGIMILLPSYTRDGSIDAVVALFQPEIEKLEQLCYTSQVL